MNKHLNKLNLEVTELETQVGGFVFLDVNCRFSDVGLAEQNQVLFPEFSELWEMVILLCQQNDKHSIQRIIPGVWVIHLGLA